MSVSVIASSTEDGRRVVSFLATCGSCVGKPPRFSPYVTKATDAIIILAVEGATSIHCAIKHSTTERMAALARASRPSMGFLSLCCAMVCSALPVLGFTLPPRPVTTLLAPAFPPPASTERSATPTHSHYSRWQKSREMSSLLHSRSGESRLGRHRSPAVTPRWASAQVTFTSSSAPLESSVEEPPPLRQVALVTKFARLPFWPIWHGLVIMFLDQIGLKTFSQTVEAAIGGRVAPMIYLPSSRSTEANDGLSEERGRPRDPDQGPAEGGAGRAEADLLSLSDPFLMNVHHRHTFFQLDPLRWLQSLVFPEGFPAHPHAGFSTLTYALKGRMRHRDSLGVKQVRKRGSETRD